MQPDTKVDANGYCNQWLLDLEKPKTQMKVLISLDISKAFDSTDLELLLMKIKQNLTFQMECAVGSEAFSLDTGSNVNWVTPSLR